MPRILDSLPVLYHDLFPPFFRGDVPPETKATCSSCAMCATSGANLAEPIDGRSRLFRPDTKCCTYHPRLPNYLLGALLADEDPAIAEGKRRVQERIESRIGATPQWLRPPATWNLLYNNARRAFGRSESLLCPYYEKQGGTCSIWPYREAVCSTFFCKYVAAADGRKLWMSLKTYLSLAEIQLSRYAVFKLCPDYILAGHDRVDPTGEPLTLEDVENKPLPDREYAGLWFQWVGRETGFYKASFDLVRALSAEEFDRMMGLDGTLALAVLEKLHRAAVSPALPQTLRWNHEATVKWLPDGSVALGSYSENDAVALPGAAYGLLVEFTGKEPVAAVRDRLRKEKQADLSEDVLLVLYQHRILVDA